MMSSVYAAGPATVWSPNPHTSIQNNWAAYRAAAEQQGHEPDDEEFALLWWQRSARVSTTSA